MESISNLPGRAVGLLSGFSWRYDGCFEAPFPLSLLSAVSAWVRSRLDSCLKVLDPKQQIGILQHRRYQPCRIPFDRLF
jgi:hypothetical protein